MDLMLRRRAMMQANANRGVRYAEGDITLASAQKLEIIHNLGTTKIALHVWPVGTVRPTAGYQAWHASMVNLNDAIPTETVLDFTAYNSEKFPEPIAINGKTDGHIAIIAGNASPWTTQPTWYLGDFKNARSIVLLTENQITHTQTWAPGTYHWIVVDLSGVT